MFIKPTQGLRVRVVNNCGPNYTIVHSPHIKPVSSECYTSKGCGHTSFDIANPALMASPKGVSNPYGFSTLAELNFKPCGGHCVCVCVCACAGARVRVRVCVGDGMGVRAYGRRLCNSPLRAVPDTVCAAFCVLHLRPYRHRDRPARSHPVNSTYHTPNRFENRDAIWYDVSKIKGFNVGVSISVEGAASPAFALAAHSITCADVNCPDAYGPTSSSFLVPASPVALLPANADRPRQ